MKMKDLGRGVELAERLNELRATRRRFTEEVDLDVSIAVYGETVPLSDDCIESLRPSIANAIDAEISKIKEALQSMGVHVES